MNNYAYRLLITIWRKKSTVVACTILIILLIFGLQYTQSDYNKDEKETTPQVLASMQLVQTDKTNVKFLDTKIVAEKIGAEVNMELSIKRQSNNNDIVNENHVAEKELERQLGIPYVNLDTQKPYVPKQRLVHFDLKGAPPTINYYKKIFPLIKIMGATGILLGNHQICTYYSTTHTYLFSSDYCVI